MPSKNKPNEKIIPAGHDMANYMRSAGRTLKSACIAKNDDVVQWLIIELDRKVRDVARFANIDISNNDGGNR